MHQLTLGVANDLNLDMARAADQFFQIHFAIAEGLLGFTAAHADQFQQRVAVFDHAHAASATAPRSFEHHGEADLFGELGNFGRIFRQGSGRRHHRHARRLGQTPRGHLITQRAHYGGWRADENHAGLRAGFGKFWAFG